MGLHYPTFMKINLENKKKLTLIRIMNNAGLNSKNIVKSVGILKDIVLLIVLIGYNVGMTNNSYV